MNITEIKKQLINHEGLRLKPYRCTAGKLTIGVGRNIEDVGISEDEAMMMLGNDIDACVDDLRGMFPDFYLLPENIQYVLVDMRFQLGPKRFRGFRMMIRAVENKDWPEMRRQMKDSAWYAQTQGRANTLIRMVKNV
ncbi:glycoside hydrolase family protein [Desulfobacter sp.]|uniref:glycoside hydrolase family protein n=1 Tax=Desulfobacter sp. TaxID=2294 RepID=UPI003D0FA3BA